MVPFSHHRSAFDRRPAKAEANVDRPVDPVGENGRRQHLAPNKEVVFVQVVLSWLFGVIGFLVLVRPLRKIVASLAGVWQYYEEVEVFAICAVLILGGAAILAGARACGQIENVPERPFLRAIVDVGTTLGYVIFVIAVGVIVLYTFFGIP